MLCVKYYKHCILYTAYCTLCSVPIWPSVLLHLYTAILAAVTASLPSGQSSASLLGRKGINWQRREKRRRAAWVRRQAG